MFSQEATTILTIFLGIGGGVKGGVCRQAGLVQDSSCKQKFHLSRQMARGEDA